MPEGMTDGISRTPVTFIRKDKFEEILNKNYSIKIQFSEEKNAYIAGKKSIDMYGYFAEQKK